MTDAEFREWCAKDNEKRCVLVELDYQYELDGAPATGTLYLSDGLYLDGESPSIHYIDCVNSVPQFRRSLSGDRLGGYQSSIGALEIDNANGEQDFMLSLAIDGSEARFYLGSGELNDLGVQKWARSDFRLIFSALSMLASAPSFDRISVQLKDTGLLLNQSIGGTSLVGGVGPNANRARPFNFGYVHNIEGLIANTALLNYVHSDTGVQTAAVAARDRGVPVTYTDDGDGTATLAATPAGTVTFDVVAEPGPDSPPGRRVSDAMREVVGVRAALLAAGKYAGAGPTFTIADDDDYLVGFEVQEARNVIDLLLAITDSGNCFWAILRTNEFTYGRLRPNDIASLGLTPRDMVEDDIDQGTFRLDHSPPQYFQYQAYMSKNWIQQTDLASSLTPDEQAVYRRPGIYKLQDPGVGTTYNDAPELYNKSLTVSPVLETLLSGAFDELDLPFLETWMETRREMFLPWIETASLTTGIDFYEEELGNVINLTNPRFDEDTGTLFQVIDINIKLPWKIDFRMVRRRLLAPPPPEWTRVTQAIETTPLPNELGKNIIITGDPFPPIGPPGSPLDIPGRSPGSPPGIYQGGAAKARYVPPSYGATDGYIVIRPTGTLTDETGTHDTAEYFQHTGSPALLASISFSASPAPTIAGIAGQSVVIDTDDKFEIAGVFDSGPNFAAAAFSIPAYSWEWSSGTVDLNNVIGSGKGFNYFPFNDSGLFGATANLRLRTWKFKAGLQEYVFYCWNPLVGASAGAPVTLGVTTRSLIRTPIGGYALPPLNPFPAAGRAWDATEFPLSEYQAPPKELPGNMACKVAGFAVVAALGTPTYTIAAGAAPVITSAPAWAPVHGVGGQTFQITATNGPTSYSCTSTPAGISLNTSTGLFSGIPVSAGNTFATLGATNANGTGTQSFAFLVS